MVYYDIINVCGEKKMLGEWLLANGVSMVTFNQRIKAGIPPELAIFKDCKAPEKEAKAEEKKKTYKFVRSGASGGTYRLVKE